MLLIEYDCTYTSVNILVILPVTKILQAHCRHKASGKTPDASFANLLINNTRTHLECCPDTELTLKSIHF